MKISLSRINSILQHSREQSGKQEPLKPNELIANNDADLVRVSSVMLKTLQNHMHEAEWVSFGCIKTIIKGKRYLVCITKTDRGLTAKQQAAAIVIKANGGEANQFSDFRTFTTWLNHIEK